MTGYRSDVPENWFVDPVNLGVPGVRRVDADEENALAWQENPERLVLVVMFVVPALRGRSRRGL